MTRRQLLHLSSVYQGFLRNMIISLLAIVLSVIVAGFILYAVGETIDTVANYGERI